MSKEDKLIAWEQHYAKSKEKEFYSIQRIDILTISISSACIYIVFEILKFLYTKESSEINSPEIVFLKISAISSAFAISINFASQILGYHANKYEASYSRETINQIKDDIEDEQKLKQIDLKSDICNDLTSISNIISAIFMLVGICTLVYYNLTIF